MRLLLLHNRIYRAFPELDRYTDVRCRKFLRAAQRGRIRRAFHWVLISLVFALVLVGGMAGIAWLVSVLFDAFDADKSTWPALGALLIPVFAAPVLAFLTRDGLLRRRIRFVLRSRGTCPACKYSLIGLPISPESLVQCPECSLETEVDPSLGELVLDESGMARFRPPPSKPPRFLTPPRIRFVKRTAKAIAILVVVGVPGLWGAYELFLRHQASIARAEKPVGEALLALAEANQPPGSEHSANAWDLLQAAVMLRARAERADSDRNPTPAGEQLYPNFNRIFDPPRDEGTQDDPRGAMEEAIARRLLEAYRQHGVYEALDRMARAPRTVRTFDFATGSLALASPRYDLSQMRHLARVSAARMKLACDHRDLPEYISALEAILAIARIAQYQPTLTDSGCGISIEAQAYDLLQDLVAEHPAPDWLDAVDAAIARQSARPPAELPWQGERLLAFDATAWVFAEPGRVRWGHPSPEVCSVLTGEHKGRLGTYAANRNAIDAAYREVVKQSEEPPWQRPQPQHSFAAAPGLLLVDLLARELEWRLRPYAQTDVVRHGYAVESALEHFYADHGCYPESLSALVPSCFETLPIDPWTGQSWGYHLRSDAASPDDPRGYVLYSFGTDCRNDGGRRTPGATQLGLHPMIGPGFDFIINDWQPPNPPSSP